MSHRLRLWIAELRTRLWVRPLALTVIALVGVATAMLADQLPLESVVPEVQAETLDALLTVIATSMLSVATFAVASMVAAYASASSSATPRSFSLVVADDVSQTALSGFIGAFIFSVVALWAVKSQLLGPQGLFLLGVQLAGIFAIVVLLLLWWVDNIARLGRLGATIDRVERAATAAIRRRRQAPTLGAAPASTETDEGVPVPGGRVGYVQAIDVGALQSIADRYDVTIVVTAPPGALVSPGRPLARIPERSESDADLDRAVVRAFRIGEDRSFQDDPRFGLIALAEVASKALSPAVNDPGTAIDIIGTLVRVFVVWAEVTPPLTVKYPRVRVPPLHLHDMFEDAFTSIARDGAGMIEVCVRLQKAFQALDALNDPTMSAVARTHARLALLRADGALTLDADRDRVHQLASRLLAED